MAMLVDTARELLAGSQLFGGLPGDSLDRLAVMADEAWYDEGEVLFRWGDPGDALHIIAAGLVEVSVESNGEETIIAVLGPGEFVGELSLIDGRPRSATVKALEPLRTVVVPRDVFLVVLRSHLPTMESLLLTVVERLRSTTALAADIGQFHSGS